jgi:Lysophospholipase
VRPRAWGWSRLSYYLLKPFVKGIARRFSENSNDPDFLAFLQADPLQPLRLPTAWVGALGRWIKRIEAAPSSPRRPLIVQGQADMTVDWEHNLEVLRGKFDRPQVLMLPEARHHLANESPGLRQEYFGFLTKRMSRDRR